MRAFEKLELAGWEREERKKKWRRRKEEEKKKYETRDLFKIPAG